MTSPGARAAVVDRFRQVHLDFHTPPWVTVGDGFDAERFGDTLLEARVNGICVFAKCAYGLSYYPTRSGTEHPGLSTDLMGAMVKACTRRGIEVLAYYSAGFDNEALLRHPGWEQVDRDGRPQFQGSGYWRSPCLASGYVDELLLPQTREILESYGVAGILYDIVFYNGEACFCEACTTLWETSGLDPGKREDRKAFQQAALDGFMARVTSSVKQWKTDAVVVYNGQLRVGARSAARSMDLFEIECLPFGTGYLYYPLYARHVRVLGTPFFGTTARFHRTWADFGTLKSAVQLQFELATMLAHGGRCRIGDQAGPSNVLEPQVYTRIGEAFAFVEDRERWCAGSTAPTEVAIVSPAETEGAGYGQCHDGVRGAGRMLMEEHVQFDVLDPAADFDPYRALIIPDRGLADDEACERIMDRVREGAILIVSGDAVFRLDGAPLWKGDAAVAVRRQSDHAAGYVRVTDPRGRELAGGMDWFVDGPFVEVSGAESYPVLADYVRPLAPRSPDRFYSHAQAPASREPSGFAGALTASVGKGILCVIAPHLFSSYHRHGMPSHRRLFNWILDILLPAGSRLFQAWAPLSVEVSLLRQEGRLVLHLVNYHAQRRGDHPEVIEEMPVWTDIAVRVACARRPVRVLLAPEGTDLPFEYRDGSAWAVVPRLHIHQMVVIEEGA